MNFLKISLFSIILLGSYNLYSMEEDGKQSTPNKVSGNVQLPTGENILEYTIENFDTMTIKTGSGNFSGTTNNWFRIKGDGQFYPITNADLVRSLNDFKNSITNSERSRSSCCLATTLILPALAILVTLAFNYSVNS